MLEIVRESEASSIEAFEPTSAAKPGWSFWQLVLLVNSPLLLCDILMVPISFQGGQECAAVLICGCFALLMAQAGFLLLVHVFGPSRVLLRTAASWGLGVSALGACILGATLAGETALPEFAAGMCLVPLLILATGTPLWLLRLIWGWRLTHPSHSDVQATSIADLFVVTALAALTLALPQWVGRQIQIDETFWPAMGIASGVMMAVSVVGLVPLLWLQMRWFRWGWAMVYAALLALIIAIPPAYTVATLFGGPIKYRELTLALLAFGLTIAAMFGGVIAGLQILRVHGWQLTIGKRQ